MADVAYGAKTILPFVEVDGIPKPSRAERKASRRSGQPDTGPSEPGQPAADHPHAVPVDDVAREPDSTGERRGSRRRLLRRGGHTGDALLAETGGGSDDTAELPTPLFDDPRSELTMLAASSSTPVAPAPTSVPAQPADPPGAPELLARVKVAEAGLQRAVSEIVRLQEFANGVVGELTITRQRLAALEQSVGRTPPA